MSASPTGHHRLTTPEARSSKPRAVNWSAASMPTHGLTRFDSAIRWSATPALSLLRSDRRANPGGTCSQERLGSRRQRWSPKATLTETRRAGLPTSVESEHLTDLGNARRLVAMHDQDILYQLPDGPYLTWDGMRFAD